MTGHRPGPKLPDDASPAVRATIAALFEHIAEAFANAAETAGWAFGPEPPEIVVVSALAEGADRYVADAGLAIGAALEVVLPSGRAIYERDFETPESTAEFRSLLTRARTVFELDNPAGALGEKRGYEAAGLVMLAHADLLIAVWDEGEAAGIGGTASIVEQAVTEGAPILLINPTTPKEARLLWTGDMDLPPAKVRVEDLPTGDAFPALPALISALVAPPTDAATRKALRTFYQEPPGPRRGWPLYSALLALLAVRPLRRTDFRPKDEHPHPPDQWRAFFPGPPEPLTEAVCNTLLPAITLPDRFAVRYSELYRSAFVFNFLAAAVAVAFALFGLATELPPLHKLDENGRLLVKVCLVAGEIGLLTAIVLIWRRGASRGWHRRWLDYRRSAEWLRHLRVLSLVGARSPVPRPRRTPGVSTEAERGERLDQDDWVGWYVRAVGRLLPPPNRAVDAAYIEAVQKAMITLELRGQINYHHDNSQLMALAAHRLHRGGLVLFGTPVVVGAGFIIAYVAYRIWPSFTLASDSRFYVTALTAAFPAFGAALNAIRVQGDFETVAMRSEEMAQRLAAIRAAMVDDPVDFARLADRIQKAVSVMSAEQSEWRTLFGSRPLSLPA